MNKIISLALLLFLLTGSVFASGTARKQEIKPAIVVSAFGTTYEKTLKSILAIVEDVERSFPNVEVRLAFTSNIIRKIWHKRNNDAAYKKAHPKVPAQLYTVKNVLGGAMADLQNEGYRHIVVQSTHVVAGEEYQDMEAFLNGLNSIKTLQLKHQPFIAIGVGKPLTGAFDHSEQIKTLAKSLKEDAIQAKKNMVGGHLFIWGGMVIHAWLRDHTMN